MLPAPRPGEMVEPKAAARPPMVPMPDRAEPVPLTVTKDAPSQALFSARLAPVTVVLPANALEPVSVQAEPDWMSRNSKPW